MAKPNPTSIRLILLALLLLVGPLHAQTLFACNMMEEVVQDECCCDEPQHNDEQATEPPEFCCEESVELSIEYSDERVAPSSKHIDVRSDVDPPQAFAVCGQYPVQISTALPSYPTVKISRSSGGTRTYLNTQRLRI